MILPILTLLLFLQVSSQSIELVESIPLKTNLATNKTTFQAWQEMISQAKKSVTVVCMYMDLSDGANYVNDGGDSGFKIFQMMNQVVDKGLQLNILAQTPNSFEPAQDLDHFKEIGANVRFLDWSSILGGGILHTKMIIADEESVYIGSANMDWKSLTQVKEMGIYIKNDRILAADAVKVFGSYWEAAANNSIPNPWPASLYTFYNSTHPHHVDSSNTVYIAASPKEFVIPDRTIDIDALTQTVANAKSSVCIEVMDYFPGTFYMKPNIFWPTIDNALRNASFHGKQVKFLVSKWPHTKKEAWAYLRSLNELDNIEVKVFEIPEWNPVIPFTRVNHAKFMVTDTHAYIGTSNWSADYFLDTAGISVNWEGQFITSSLQSAFDRDWASEFATPL